MSRNNRDAAIIDVISLLRYLVAFASDEDAIAKLIAIKFKAQSATIWVRDSIVKDEFCLRGVYNREDIPELNHYSFFLGEVGSVASSAFSLKSPIEGCLGKEPFCGEWLAKPYTELIQTIGIRYVIVCPVCEDNGAPFCVVSLYFSRKPNRFSRRVLREFCSFIYCVHKSVTSSLDAYVKDRRKLGHDITAHLGSISLSLKKIKRGLTADEFIDMKKNIGDLEGAVEVIESLATDSKKSSALELRRRMGTPNNFSEIYHSVLQPLISGVKKEDIVLLPLISGGDVVIVLPEADLRTILTNFATNAIKYSPPTGTIKARIVRDAHGGALFSMANTSFGIAEEDIPFIWKDGFRGKNAKSQRVGGQGLGLGIVHDICAIHSLKYGHREIPPDDVSWRTRSEFWVLFPAEITRWA